MKKEAADQKRKAEEEKIKTAMEQAKRQEDEKNLQRYVGSLQYKEALEISSGPQFLKTKDLIIGKIHLYCLQKILSFFFLSFFH